MDQPDIQRALPKKAEPHQGIFRILETDEEMRVFPSELAGGPWNPAHQHGGAVSGLLTRALDQIESPGPMRLSRITVEMFRGVPLTPLRLETRIVRGGRRIQSAEATLFDQETPVARATGLRIRVDETMQDLHTPMGLDPAVGTPPEAAPDPMLRANLEFMPGFISAVDIVSDGATQCGEPANLWTRLRCRLVEGEQTAPIPRLATLVDFASGTGNAMDYSQFTSINPDLTIHVLREPHSDWIGIRGSTLRAADGIGQSTAVVYDLEGPVARVQASLLLDRR